MSTRDQEWCPKCCRFWQRVLGIICPFCAPLRCSLGGAAHEPPSSPPSFTASVGGGYQVAPRGIKRALIRCGDTRRLVRNAGGELEEQGEHASLLVEYFDLTALAA